MELRMYLKILSFMMIFNGGGLYASSPNLPVASLPSLNASAQLAPSNSINQPSVNPTPYTPPPSTNPELNNPPVVNTNAAIQPPSMINAPVIPSSSTLLVGQTPNPIINPNVAPLPNSVLSNGSTECTCPSGLKLKIKHNGDDISETSIEDTAENAILKRAQNHAESCRCNDGFEIDFGAQTNVMYSKNTPNTGNNPQDNKNSQSNNEEQKTNSPESNEPSDTRNHTENLGEDPHLEDKVDEESITQKMPLFSQEDPYPVTNAVNSNQPLYQPVPQQPMYNNGGGFMPGSGYTPNYGGGGYGGGPSYGGGGFGGPMNYGGGSGMSGLGGGGGIPSSNYYQPPLPMNNSMGFQAPSMGMPMAPSMPIPMVTTTRTTTTTTKFATPKPYRKTPRVIEQVPIAKSTLSPQAYEKLPVCKLAPQKNSLQEEMMMDLVPNWDRIPSNLQKRILELQNIFLRGDPNAIQSQCSLLTGAVTCAQNKDFAAWAIQECKSHNAMTSVSLCVDAAFKTFGLKF
jgi:hypothetical protein